MYAAVRGRQDLVHTSHQLTSDIWVQYESQTNMHLGNLGQRNLTGAKAFQEKLPPPLQLLHLGVQRNRTGHKALQGKQTTRVTTTRLRYGVATISRLLQNYRSLLQNKVSGIGLLCKRDIQFLDAY